MKHIIFFFSLLLISFFISGQEIIPTAEELEKLTVRERVDPPRGVEEEKPTIQRFAGEEPREIQTEVRNHFLPGTTPYAWVVYTDYSGVAEGPVNIDLETGQLASIAEVDGDILWMIGADMADDTWYAVNYDQGSSGLYTIDPVTGEYELIGHTGFSLTGLAYDPTTGIMYGSGITGEISRLYTVNLTSGQATLVGSIMSGLVIGIAADIEGNLFGVKIDNNGLISINKETGSGSWIGEIGFNINYAQDIAFDRDNGILYGALFNGLLGGALYTIDTSTGQASWVDTYYAQAAGLAIPYTWAEDQAPAAVAGFTATPGAEGALDVALDWTNPSLQYNGEALSALTSLVVERNGQVVHAIENPVPGASASWQDTDISEAGVYRYRIYAVNETGEGAKTTVWPFVGEDLPGPPQQAGLSPQNDDGMVTWETPATGLRGGYFDPSAVSYSLTRMPGEVVVADEITATEFLDTTIPDMGNYYYIITAKSAIGAGGSTDSDVALLKGGYILLYENFDYPVRTVPRGWLIETDGQQPNWRVNDENTAGGEAPQIRFDYLPRFEGTARLVSRTIETNDFSMMRLRWNQYLGQWMDFVEGNIALDVSFDEGDTWQNQWIHLVDGDIPASVKELFVEIPPGATTLNLGFTFIGDNFSIYEWDIDNVILEPVYDYDLKAVSIAGNAFPSEDTENYYAITVRNLGLLTQSDYTVKLMMDDGTEIAAVEGDPIDFAQSITYNIPWTPEAGSIETASLYGYVELAGDQLPGNNQTAMLDVELQPQGIFAVSVGDGTLLARDPYNFIMHHSLNQTIYYRDEISMGGGAITSIQYYNNFIESYMDREIKIWMGETTEENLINGWVDPSSLTLVFDGTVDFPAGENNILITLDEPYEYQGGNLVIYNNKADTQWKGLQSFYNTMDEGSYRARRAHRDNTPFDPANPDLPGTLVDNFANITMFFSIDGMGNFSGTVTDGETPMEGVNVHVEGTQLNTLTTHNGHYVFPYLPAGTYNVIFSKFGYQDSVAEGIVVTDGGTTTVDATLTERTQHIVEGVVEGNDGLLIADAEVLLQGYADYLTLTNEEGAFLLEDVWAGTYTLTINAEGYDVFVMEDIVIEEDVDWNTLVITKTIGIPGALSVDTDLEGEGDALFSWHLGFDREFRYDDGMVETQLGASNGTQNTVLGSVHRNKATLYEMSWYLTEMGGPHTHIAVWVFGLDQNGLPDRHNILYSMGNVPNVDNQWNTYEFSTPVEAPDGFLIGVSYSGFIGLGMDSGEDDEWGFVENTHYVSTDFNTTAFSPIEGFGFEHNFAMRAFGHDYEELAFDLEADAPASSNAADNHSFVAAPLDEPVYTGEPRYMSTPASFAAKDLLGFRVFLNDMENPVAENVAEMHYLFEGLAEGDYMAGIQSVYPTGSSEIVTLGFEMLHGVPVTILVETNSGDSPNNAHVVLSGIENEEDVYEHTVGHNGQAYFNNVYTGTYELEVSLGGFYTYTTELNIQETLTYTVELVEILAEPFGLEVDTESVLPGEALFSWNNDPDKVLTGYIVCLNNVPEATGITETSYLFTGLPAGTHTAGVRAVYTTGESQRADISFTIEQLPDNTHPVTFTVLDQTGTYEALRIKGEMTSPAWIDVPLNKGPANIWTVTLSVLPGTYQWGVTEDDGTPDGEWLLPEGENLTFTLHDNGSVSGNVSYVLTPVGISEIFDESFSLFPNPAYDHVTLLSPVKMIEIRLIDAGGRVIYEGKPRAEEYRMNLQHLEGGIYYVHIVTDGFVFIRKLQVQ